MINFENASTLSAARAYVSSLRWRLAVGSLFALGAAYVLSSVPVGVGWFLALALSTGFDALLGRSYLEARIARLLRTSGALFVWGCAFSVMVLAAMTLQVAAMGGGPGRVLAVLMAASVFVSAMLFLFESRAFMVMTAAPAVVCLMVMPFLPLPPSSATALQGAIGVGCGVAGFLAYVLRAAFYNADMMEGLRAANAQAKARQAEAEVKRVEAEEASRVKTEFLKVITHELRTPLNAVIGYAEMIHEDMAEEGRAEIAQDALRISGSAHHLLGLIDQIINVTADAGHDELAVREFDVRALAEEAIAALQDEARANGNRISLRVGERAERASTDAGKLTVCVKALLSNAAKFTQNGLIAVTADRDVIGDVSWLVISVSDTGCGIAAENIPYLFQPFWQLEGGETRAKGGMGLGLSVAQRLARSLGGDIEVRSEEGVGSTFTLRTPYRAADLELRTAA